MSFDLASTPRLAPGPTGRVPFWPAGASSTQDIGVMQGGLRFVVDWYYGTGEVGTDDLLAAQAAADAAAGAGGGVVVLPDRDDLTFGGPLLIRSSNMAVVGSSATKITVASGANSSAIVVASASPFATALSDVRLEGFTVDHNASNQTNATMDGSQVGSVRCLNVQRLTVTNVTLLNSLTFALNMRTCPDARIIGNIVDGVTTEAAANGINVQEFGQAGVWLPQANVVVANNVVKNVEDLGILIARCDGAVVVGNVVSGCEIGVMSEGGNNDQDQLCRKTAITGNTVINCELGIAASDTSAPGQTITTVTEQVIAGNMVSGCATGIQVNGAWIVVTGNSVHASTAQGIIVGREYPFDEQAITIASNVVQADGGRGIVVGKENAVAELRDVSVVGNIVDAAPDATLYGIEVRGNVSGCLVANNMVRNTGRCSIRLSFDSTVSKSPQYVCVTGNVCRDPNGTNQGAAAEGAAIGVNVDAPDSMIFGNLLIDGRPSGSRLMLHGVAGSATRPIWFNNRIVNAVTSEYATSAPLGSVAAAALGFYGTAPVAKQTGVAVTAEGIHAALVNLGLISA